MPCVNPPFAMTNFVAQTDENKISRMPCVYEDSAIIGFLATHQPTVWIGDYGYVSIMPEIGQLATLPEQRKLTFNHRQEQSTPYYYSVTMHTPQNKKLKAEITATERCGLFRFTFPRSEQAHLVVQGINLKNNSNHINSSANWYRLFSGNVHVDPEKKEITGYNPDRMSLNLGPGPKHLKGYFVIKFDKPFKQFGTWDNDSTYASHIDLTAKRMGAYISFKTYKNEKVSVKIGTSFISIDQARENLRHEIPGWDFKRVARKTRNKWQQALARIQVQDIPENKKTIFYAAMFHTLLFPRKFSEYGQYYSAFDDKVHKGVSYNDSSLWDTFWALHPLLIFTQPNRVNPMIASLLHMYKDGGWLPKWPNSYLY